MRKRTMNAFHLLNSITLKFTNKAVVIIKTFGFAVEKLIFILTKLFPRSHMNKMNCIGLKK